MAMDYLWDDRCRTEHRIEIQIDRIDPGMAEQEKGCQHSREQR